jgi:5-methylcytosine-specific restriction endonuclease McrA
MSLKAVAGVVGRWLLTIAGQQPPAPRNHRQRHRSLASSRVRRLKARLAERDGACCFYCRQPFTQLRGEATLDHLVPFAKVPTWNPAALVLACRACNEAKADRLPSLVLAELFGDRRFTPGLRLTPEATSAPHAAVAVV